MGQRGFIHIGKKWIISVICVLDFLKNRHDCSENYWLGVDRVKPWHEKIYSNVNKNEPVKKTLLVSIF